MTRDEAIQELKSDIEWSKLNRYPYISQRKVEAINMAIKALEQEPKTGHWVDRFPAKECKCSVCDFLICISNGSYIDMVGQMKYCPNCGARMAESEDKE